MFVGFSPAGPVSTSPLTGVGESADPTPPVSPVAPIDAEPMLDDEGSEEIVLEEPGEEAASVPVLRDPGEPTQAEVDQHNLTHAAFRSWCPHCVRGRGRNAAHRTIRRDADALPTLSFDYCFLGSKNPDEDHEQESAGMTPVIVMHDDVSGSVFAHAVPKKGVDYEELPLAVRAVTHDIYSLGYKRVIFRDDQEPALVAFLQAVRRALMGEVVFENSAVGDPQSNGAAERGVQTVKDFSRTLRDALEDRLGRAVAADSALMSWLVTHAATVHRRYAVGSDGRSAYQRNKGKPASAPVVEFGEKVFYKPLSSTRQAADAPRFEFGYFIGLSEVSNEVILAAATGNVVKARCIRRLPKSQRWSTEWIPLLTGTELQPNPGEYDTRIRVRLDPQVAADVQVPAPKPAPPRTRSVRLSESDFWDAGFTEDCRGCQLILEGSRQSRVHTAACRRRMEEHLATTADGRRRLLAAEERKAIAGARQGGDGPGGDARGDPVPAIAAAAAAVPATAFPAPSPSTPPAAPHADHFDTDVAVSIPNAQNVPNADGSGCWTREDRYAQRFRSTAGNGPEWKDVVRRVTVDADTGEVLEDLQNPQGADRSVLCRLLPGGCRNIRTSLYYIPPRTATTGSSSAAATAGSVPALLPEVAAPPPPQPDFDMAEARRAARRGADENLEGPAKQRKGGDAQDNEGDVSMSRVTVEGEDPVALELSVHHAAGPKAPGAEHEIQTGDGERIDSEDWERDVLAILDGVESGRVQGVGEVYSPPRVVLVARRRGLGGGWSLDILTHDREGRPWDFDQPDAKQRARDLLNRTKPKLLIGSPMCTHLSAIMHLAKLNMAPEDYQARLDPAT